ncbi:MAG: cytochrome c3 family protein [Acidobacteriota bacterium]
MPLPGAPLLFWLGRRPMLAGTAGFFLLGTLFFSSDNPGAAGAQPIAFNHAKHVGSGMGCTDCHAGAQSGVRATLPTLAMCLTCHATALTESTEESKLRQFAAAGKEPPWAPLPRVPAHVYFSHRRHVQLGGLACATCHGPMEKATTPPQSLFRPLTMDECIGCHEQSLAGTDCNDCHR